MKIRYFTVLLALMFAFVQLDAQVNNVKKKSQQNKKNRTTNNNNNRGGGGGTNPGCADACLNACVSGCAQIGAQIIVAGQQAYLDRRDEVPHMVSIDIMPHGGYLVSNDESFQLMPRLRGNWGMFSTDIRFSSWFELDSANKLDFYNTTDWQIIEFNPVITKNFILRIGTGFMYEHSSKIFYNEHYLGGDVLWDDFKYMITAEGRWAKDYQTGANPRTEANVRFNYRYFRNKHFHCYLMFGGLYQNYYSRIDNYAVQTGVTVNFH